MKMKVALFLCSFLFITMILSACSASQEEPSYRIFYLNQAGTRLEPSAYHWPGESESTEGLIAALIEQLREQPPDVELRTPISSSVELLGWELDQHKLTLDFNSAYLSLPIVEEVMGRAAIVYTLIQVEGVDGILFSAGGNPIMGGNGSPLGLMTADSFVENPGEDIGEIQIAPLTLYFSSEDGTHLVEEVREVHYARNFSMEKLIVEQLIDGPENSELLATIPAGTKLLNVSVLGGLCFVNFDEGFFAQNFAVEEGVVIYSIVNSLTELPSVNQVQIAVNGDTNLFFRELFSLNTTYTRNLDYMNPVEESVETISRGGRVRN